MIKDKEISDLFCINYYEQTESTQQAAKDLLDDPSFAFGQDDRHNVILTEQQTSGRGKYQRVWHSQGGDLALTIILKPDVDLALYSQVCYIAAISVGSALFKITDEKLDVAYKWVNDILLNKKKVSGILLELHHSKLRKKDFLLVGIGVNIVHSLVLDELGATSLNSEGIELNSNDLLYLILEKFHFFYILWQTYGFAEVRQKWLERAVALDSEVSVAVPGRAEKVRGIFHSISQTGELEVRQGDAISLVRAGDLFW